MDAVTKITSAARVVLAALVVFISCRIIGLNAPFVFISLFHQLSQAGLSCFGCLIDVYQCIVYAILGTEIDEHIALLEQSAELLGILLGLNQYLEACILEDLGKGNGALVVKPVTLGLDCKFDIIQLRGHPIIVAIPTYIIVISNIRVEI